MKKQSKRKKARYPWATAPDWASWAAKDSGGDSYWYETKPVRSRGYWRFPRDTVPRSQYLGWLDAVGRWNTSLEARPASVRMVTKKPKRKPATSTCVRETTRIVIWTQSYQPFIMGGDVHRPISCEIDAVGPFNLGRGFKGYVVSKPGGMFRVVESSSGGIVGETLEQVRADIKDADLEFMKSQVHDGRHERDRATRLDEQTFWARMR